MANLKLSGDTSGVITVAAPAVAGTNTITLPAETGTILTNQTSVGKILQVVSATQNTEVTTTSSSLIDTGLTATITPSATSSKIVVFYSMPILVQTTEIIQVALIRGSTNILNNVRGMQTANPQLNVIISNCFLDSPSTTSATTYKIQFSHGSTASSVSAAMWNSESPS